MDKYLISVPAERNANTSMIVDQYDWVQAHDMAMCGRGMIVCSMCRSEHAHVATKWCTMTLATKMRWKWLVTVEAMIKLIEHRTAQYKMELIYTRWEIAAVSRYMVS